MIAGQVQAAQFDAVSDLGSQVEYAYYTDDARALERAVQQLSTAQGDDTARQIYLHYGQWKLAQLLISAQPEQAAAQASRCMDYPDIDRTSATSSVAAIHLAVQAACAQLLSSVRPLRAVLYRRERDAAIKPLLQGTQPAPVLLILGWLQLPDASAAARLQQATAAYDAVPAGTAAYLSCGAAEASYWLGTLHRQQGRVTAARDALEKALALAPDYRAAHALLKELSL